MTTPPNLRRNAENAGAENRCVRFRSNINSHWLLPQITRGLAYATRSQTSRVICLRRTDCFPCFSTSDLKNMRLCYIGHCRSFT